MMTLNHPDALRNRVLDGEKMEMGVHGRIVALAARVSKSFQRQPRHPVEDLLHSLRNMQYFPPMRAAMKVCPEKTIGAIQMAKAMTKSQIVAGVAEATGLTKKQAAAAIETLASMAYKGAKNGFTVPGLGKLVLVNRKARMGRNPATGEKIKIKAKRVVKFRVAKACKEAVL
jgi:DNA-binding protein HU-beta